MNNQPHLDWKRDVNGKPKRTDKGSYVLVKDGQIYFGVYPSQILGIRYLLDEMATANADFLSKAK